MLYDEKNYIRLSAIVGLINFGEFTEGIDHLLESERILKDLVGKLIEEKDEEVLGNVVKLLKMLMQGEEGTPKALQTEIISRLINLVEHNSDNVLPI